MKKNYLYPIVPQVSLLVLCSVSTLSCNVYKSFQKDVVSHGFKPTESSSKPQVSNSSIVPRVEHLGEIYRPTESGGFTTSSNKQKFVVSESKPIKPVFGENNVYSSSFSLPLRHPEHPDYEVEPKFTKTLRVSPVYFEAKDIIPAQFLEPGSTELVTSELHSGPRAFGNSPSIILRYVGKGEFEPSVNIPGDGFGNQVVGIQTKKIKISEKAGEAELVREIPLLLNKSLASNEIKKSLGKTFIQFHSANGEMNRITVHVPRADEPDIAASTLTDKTGIERLNEVKKNPSVFANGSLGTLPRRGNFYNIEISSNQFTVVPLLENDDGSVVSLLIEVRSRTVKNGTVESIKVIYQVFESPL